MADEWFTPIEIFNQLGLCFDLDVAAPLQGNKHVPADKSYTVVDDGLKQPWYGRVWMNPPYSKPKPWVDKWLEHGNGLALLPMAKSRWFEELMRTNAKFIILPTNLKFTNPDGQKVCHMMASTLWALGESNVEAISRLGKVR